jgi:AraC-like DNA-binding protein
MPSSAVLRFTDPDAYYAAIRTAEVKGVVTTRGDYRAELTRIELHRLWMQRGVEGLPRVMNVRRRDPRVAVFFMTEQEQSPLQVRGMVLGTGEIAVLGSGSADHHLSSAACRWGAMSLTPEDLAEAGQAIVGRELTAPSSLTYRLRPSPATLLRLLNLHEAAGHLASAAPDILEKHEVTRAIEHRLIHAMVTCISEGEAVAPRTIDRNHAAVMRRLEETLHANSDRTLYLAELCAAAGTSARTLLACCHEHLGMGPMRYLWLRRMPLARRALRTADLATTTVTEIATDYGFWELGRFSVSYRTLFGETPSASLRRPSQDLRPWPRDGSPWKFAEIA